VFTASLLIWTNYNETLFEFALEPEVSSAFGFDQYLSVGLPNRTLIVTPRTTDN